MPSPAAVGEERDDGDYPHSGARRAQFITNYLTSQQELIDENLDKIAKRRQDAQEQAENRKETLAAAVSRFQARLAELERDYPASLLVGEPVR